MSHTAVSSSSPTRPGRPLTIASYVLTAVSFVAPGVLAAIAIALGLTAASRGDRAGRAAAMVAVIVLVLEVLFFLLWAFGVVRIPF